jgi:hypothetical protein
MKFLNLLKEADRSILAAHSMQSNSMLMQLSQLSSMVYKGRLTDWKEYIKQ